jgi:hypothetical protein
MQRMAFILFIIKKLKFLIESIVYLVDKKSILFIINLYKKNIKMWNN